MLKKYFLIFIFTILLFSNLLIVKVESQAVPSTICYDPFCEEGLIKADTGLGDVEPTIIMARIINTCLTLLGIVSLVLMVYAGFIWMLARGNDEEIKRAQEILKGAAFGLIIILASYSFAHFVFYNLEKITNAY